VANPSLTASREACQKLTRHHAKTFYFASHVLPALKRSDAYAVYAFCRHVDDQVDLAPDEPARLRALADLSHLLHSVYLEEGGEHEACFGMDRGRVRVQNWEELDLYCYRVAGVVGLIMVHVMAEPKPELLKPARDLGTAMQLTNILRDIAEDWQRDRLYLPADELEKFGLTDEDIAQQRLGDSFRAMMRYQIGRARAYYSYGDVGIPSLPTDGSRFCARLMSTIYSAILDEIERANYDVFRGRVHVSFARKLWLAVTKCSNGA